MPTKLDLDESILTRKLLLDSCQGSSAFDQELTQLLPDAPTPVASVKPKPGICVKARRTDDHEPAKLFVNVCVSEVIPAPEDITQQELIEILESEEENDFRVPMSIGEPHQEKDNNGSPCTAYDIIIHPSFLDKVRDDPVFNNFLIIAALEGLESKYKITIDKQGWKVLVNKMYHGKMSDQTIRTSMPLVQELSGRRKVSQNTQHSLSLQKENKDEMNRERHQRLLTPVNTKKIEAKDNRMKPKFIIKKFFGKTQQLTGIRAEVKLPGVGTGKDVGVYCGEDRIIVEHSSYFLDIILPCTMNADHASVHYVSQQQTMVIDVPASKS